MYSMLKEHIKLLRLMFDRCRQLQISLNLNKCIFCVPFGNLLGHIVCREGVLVDPAKVAVIVNLPPPKTVKQLRSTMGHTGHYRRFIRNYTTITASLEKLLKKAEVFEWTPAYDDAFNLLKEKLVSAPILTYPNWIVEFHVHIDASRVALGVVLI